MSFVLNDDASVRLSPLYDVFSTLAYPQLSTAPGMRVDGIGDIRQITSQHLVAEAVSWGVDESQARHLVAETCTRARFAVARSADEIDAPISLVALLTNRVASFSRS